MTDRLRVGVVGCGVIGSKHIEVASASPAIELTAVADLQQELAHRTAAQYGVPAAYSSADQLIDDANVDAVVLAMPAAYRKEPALRCFAAGKHVLIEKPVARNVDEVRELLSAQGDCVAACCSARYHFTNSAPIVTDFLATGSLGPLRVVRCRAIVPAGPPPQKPPPNWRLSRALNGGGILMNWGCYDLDYLLGITGWTLRPTMAFAQTWTVPAAFRHYASPNSDAESHVTALVRCDDDTVISYERAEFVAARAETTWEIIGEQGSLVLKMTAGKDNHAVHFFAGAEQGSELEILWQGDDSNDAIHAGPLNDLAGAVLKQRAPQTDLRRALTIQAVTDAIYESAAGGRCVTIESLASG